MQIPNSLVSNAYNSQWVQIQVLYLSAITLFNKIFTLKLLEAGTEFSDNCSLVSNPAEFNLNFLKK